MATPEIELPPLHATDVAGARFSMGRRGYAPDEVHRYLRTVAEHLSRLEGEIDWHRARGEHLERRSAAAQEAAYARLSRDFAEVVRRADEAANRVRADAEARARAALTSAHQEAAQIVAAAGDEAEEILTAARAEAERIFNQAAAATARSGDGSGPDGDFHAMWGDAGPTDQPQNGTREDEGAATALFDPSMMWTTHAPGGDGDVLDLAGLEDLQSLRDFAQLEQIEEAEHLGDLERELDGRDLDDMDVHLEASLFDLFDDLGD